jgi:Tfp pilus assembly protein PilF
VDPSDPTAQGSLAIALMKSGEGNAAEAMPHFAEAVRLEPRSYPLRINYGTALCGAGRIDECLVQLQEAERLDPKSIDAPLLSARAHAAAGRLDAALVSLESALARATATGQADRAAELREIIRQTKLAIGR